MMSLVANAYPSSEICELIASNRYVYVIANALIDKCFFGKIKLIPVMADINKTYSWIAICQLFGVLNRDCSSS